MTEISKSDDQLLDEMLGIRPPLPPATAGNRLKRADPKKQLAPQRLTELTAQHRLMLRYMVWGISSPVIARQHGVGVDYPLSFRDAALAARVRVHRARTLINDPVFRQALADELRNYRASIAGAAIRTIEAIVEDPGENTAADRTVRLKAAAAILGDAVGATPARPQVNVTVNNGHQITAGIVIRVPSGAEPAAVEEKRHPTLGAFQPPRTIDAAPLARDPATLQMRGKRGGER